MKDIREVFPDALYSDGTWSGAYDYYRLVESMGYEILIWTDVGQYQGDSLVLLRNGERYGILVFGWGSCTVCDALQSCKNYEEIEALRSSLHESIVWMRKDEVIPYVKKKREHAQFEWVGEAGLDMFLKDITRFKVLDQV